MAPEGRSDATRGSAAVHRDRVVAAGEVLAVPGGPPLLEFEPGLGAAPVVFIECQSVWAQLEPRDQQAAGGYAVAEVVEHPSLGAGRDEDHDVAGQHHEVEPGVQLVGQVGQVRPTQRSSGAFARAPASIAASASTPVTENPRRDNSIATRPVPHPASSTRRQPDSASSDSTRSASPWTLWPFAASVVHRAS